MNTSLEIKSPRIYSFFSGAGFLDLGFENSGFEIAYVNEVHPPFLEAYKYSRKKLNYPNPKYGFIPDDITNCLSGKNAQQLETAIEADRLDGHLVGFIGGPPCPDFSVGGKNKGKDGENGKLSKTYIDLISQFKPDFFLFENVKGLLKTKRHKEFFDNLKTQLKKSGYDLTERLINSIEYGAPQDRERIILFGVLESSFPDGVKTFDWLTHIRNPGRSAFEYDWPVADEPSITREASHNIDREISLQYWFDKNDVENHPNSLHHFKPKAALERFITTKEGDVSKKSFKRLHRWRYSPTAAYGNNEVHIHPYYPRRISAAEALAIQSLPKEFELPGDMTLTNMFKTIGNGVPYLAAKGIALSISDFINKAYKNENHSK